MRNTASTNIAKDSENCRGPFGTLLGHFWASFFQCFLDPLLGPIFFDFGAQRPPKWRRFRGHLVDFLLILRKSANWCFPLRENPIDETAYLRRSPYAQYIFFSRGFCVRVVEIVKVLKMTPRRNSLKNTMQDGPGDMQIVTLNFPRRSLSQFYVSVFRWCLLCDFL